MPRYTHTLDLAFNVHSEHDYWANVSVDELLAALRQRVEYISDLRHRQELGEVFGHVDTHEEELVREGPEGRTLDPGD